MLLVKSVGMLNSRRIRLGLRILRAINPRKIRNVVKVEFSLATGKEFISCTPYLAAIDISSSCNLQCPMCETGRGEVTRRKNEMTIDSFSKLLSGELGKNLLCVFLYSWSEPFLSNDVYNIIRECKRRGICTVISSNLSLRIDPDELVRSELDYLIISADGFDQRTYEMYRVNGSLDKVKKNVMSIRASRKRMGLSTPILDWQYLEHKFNKATKRSSLRKARMLGADLLTYRHLNFEAVKGNHEEIDKWSSIPSDDLISYSFNTKKRRTCSWLWRWIVVNCDLTYAPCCCYDYTIPKDSSAAKLWESDWYREMRLIGSGSEVPHGEKLDGSSPCYNCTSPSAWRKSFRL